MQTNKIYLIKAFDIFSYFEEFYLNYDLGKYHDILMTHMRRKYFT